MNYATTMMNAEPQTVFGRLDRCRKCGTDVRNRVPYTSELRGRVDREVRCTNPECRTLIGIWTTSTGDA